MNAVDQINQSFGGGNWLDGLSLCFELAEQNQDVAANIFINYWPDMIKSLHAWAVEVSQHTGVFLPDHLYGTDMVSLASEIEAFQDDYARVIESQRAKHKALEKKAILVSDMSANKAEIDQGLDRWHIDQRARQICQTKDPARLKIIEDEVLRVAEKKVKESYRRRGRRATHQDPTEIRSKAIQFVRKNDAILEIVSKNLRFIEKNMKDLHLDTD